VDFDDFIIDITILYLYIHDLIIPELSRSFAVEILGRL
jgi:hypothetical protein